MTHWGALFYVREICFRFFFKVTRFFNEKMSKWAFETIYRWNWLKSDTWDSPLGDTPFYYFHRSLKNVFRSTFTIIFTFPNFMHFRLKTGLKNVVKCFASDSEHFENSFNRFYCIITFHYDDSITEILQRFKYCDRLWRILDLFFSGWICTGW